jgi:hypothetical protein
MKRSYAVAWSKEEELGSGRLEPHGDHFELHGRGVDFAIRFSDLTGASIARRQADRLRGLPVLLLQYADGGSIRIASLEGPGVLSELVEQIQRAGLAVAV